MAKTQTVYTCQQCGYKSAKWVGRCPSCAEWNTLVEEKVQPKATSKYGTTTPKTTPQLITALVTPETQRLVSGNAELDRVLGGGIVPGSLVLVGGEPGIGKSTLMLQVAVSLNNRFLYVSGEESEAQVKMRADRIGIRNSQCYILTETGLAAILSQVEQIEPEVIVIDSIQTLHSELIESAPGSISQIRECTAELIKMAKSKGIPVFIIGHVTKDGFIAGPKVLEHMVDTVLQFEGDRHHNFRILRTTKNRFGSTSEIGIYEMRENGLREVTNPSEILLSQKQEQLSGIAIGAALEGMRPLLIETQALVSTAVYGTPQRNSNGFDLRRLNMLLAVLEKRCGFRLAQQDVFINIAGGLKIEDPAIDMAIIAAILSSYEDMYIPYQYAFVGEIGLSGEVRPVSKIEHRIAEAAKLGFEKIFISQNSIKGLVKNPGIEIHGVSKVEELFSELFG